MSQGELLTYIYWVKRRKSRENREPEENWTAFVFILSKHLSLGLQTYSNFHFYLLSGADNKMDAEERRVMIGPI